MTQQLHPIYGDYLNDTYIARATGARPGIMVAPAVTQAPSGSDVAVTLNPDSDLGFWAWKTRWIISSGAFTFTEDAPVVVTSLDVTANPYQLLVARWKWTTGTLDVNGHPNGDYEAGMHPVYQFEAGVAGDMAQGLIQSSIAQPDINGRYGVVLGVLDHGQFSFQESTFIDPAVAIRHGFFSGTFASAGAFNFSGGTDNAAFQTCFTVGSTLLTAKVPCNVLCTYVATINGNSGSGTQTWNTTAAVSKNGTVVGTNATELYGSTGTLHGQITAVVTTIVPMNVGDTLSFTQTNTGPSAVEIGQQLTIAIL